MKNNLFSKFIIATAMTAVVSFFGAASYVAAASACSYQECSTQQRLAADLHLSQTELNITAGEYYRLDALPLVEAAERGWKIDKVEFSADGIVLRQDRLPVGATLANSDKVTGEASPDLSLFLKGNKPGELSISIDLRNENWEKDCPKSHAHTVNLTCKVACLEASNASVSNAISAADTLNADNGADLVSAIVGTNQVNPDQSANNGNPSSDGQTNSGQDQTGNGSDQKDQTGNGSDQKDQTGNGSDQKDQTGIGTIIGQITGGQTGGQPGTSAGNGSDQGDHAGSDPTGGNSGQNPDGQTPDDGKEPDDSGDGNHNGDDQNEPIKVDLTDYALLDLIKVYDGTSIDPHFANGLPEGVHAKFQYYRLEDGKPVGELMDQVTDAGDYQVIITYEVDEGYVLVGDVRQGAECTIQRAKPTIQQVFDSATGHFKCTYEGVVEGDIAAFGSEVGGKDAETVTVTKPGRRTVLSTLTIAEDRKSNYDFSDFSSDCQVQQNKTFNIVPEDCWFYVGQDYEETKSGEILLQLYLKDLNTDMIGIEDLQATLSFGLVCEGATVEAIVETGDFQFSKSQDYPVNYKHVDLGYNAAEKGALTSREIPICTIVLTRAEGADKVKISVNNICLQPNSQGGANEVIAAQYYAPGIVAGSDDDDAEMVKIAYGLDKQAVITGGDHDEQTARLEQHIAENFKKSNEPDEGEGGEDLEDVDESSLENQSTEEQTATEQQLAEQDSLAQTAQAIATTSEPVAAAGTTVAETSEAASLTEAASTETAEVSSEGATLSVEGATELAEQTGNDEFVQDTADQTYTADTDQSVDDAGYQAGNTDVTPTPTPAPSDAGNNISSEASTTFASGSEAA